MKYPKEDYTFLQVTIAILGLIFLIGGTFMENWHSIIGGFLMCVVATPYVSVIHYQGKEKE